MADWRYIALAMGTSAAIIVGVGVWIAVKDGSSPLDALRPASSTYDEVLPGPLENEKVLPADSKNKAMNADAGTGNPTVTLKTNRGDIAILMYQDLMPITVGNFVKLAGEDFYDSTKFHRVIEGFMIQGGDPNSKGSNPAFYGQGGPGYTIKDEFVSDPRLSNTRGTIAMANTGQPNSGGSQFFINLVDNTGLDFDKPPQSSSHPVFGRVVKGMDIVDAIGATETGAGDVPVDPVIVEDVLVSYE